MSWLFAILDPREGGRSIPFRYGVPLAEASCAGFTAVVGGIPETCFLEDTGTSGWAVVGTGIRADDGCRKILTKEGWSGVMARDSFDAAELDGHFVALRWSRGGIECFTDQLGLRALYYAEYAGGLCLSTRLDWVAGTTGRSELDLSALGGRWLLLNQIRYASCVKGIQCLGPAGRLTAQPRSSPAARHSAWTPSFGEGSPAEAVETLKSFLSCAVNSGFVPSLGLSGGLDSRLLLALLAEMGEGSFEAHTIGEPADPDVRIAGEISRAVGIRLTHLNDPLPGRDACISALASYAAQSHLTEPCSSYVKARYHAQIRAAGRMMIDGGFGEVARRQFFNRMVRLGQPAVRRRDPARLFRLVRLRRADIFSPDVHEALVQGALSGLQEALDSMPAAGDIGLENFADLFAVRTRIPNYGGPEQARMDGEVLNFMPYAQPSYIRSAFRLPLRLRRRGLLYRGTARRVCPAVCRFPLAKGGKTHPFGIAGDASRVYTGIASLFIAPYSDSQRQRLLGHLREFVLDLAHAGDASASSLVDRKKVIDVAARYYRGEFHLAEQLDWWLTFELWRQSLRAAPE